MLVIIVVQILVEITFRRNWHHWFWKIMFPLDVITAVGFAMFLLMPQVPVQGPTADQRIAMATYLVTVLLAQVSTQLHSLFPDSYPELHFTLVGRIHYFCKALASQGLSHDYP
jgi:hypothetical protein